MPSKGLAQTVVRCASTGIVVARISVTTTAKPVNPAINLAKGLCDFNPSAVSANVGEWIVFAMDASYSVPVSGILI